MSKFTFNRLFGVLITLCLGTADSFGGRASTGKIIIDGQDYSSGINGVTQGNGKRQIETRSVKKFSGIVIKTSLNVEFSPSSKSQVTVTADSNLLPIIQTKVINNALVIFSEHSFSSNRKNKVAVTGPMIKFVKIEGSADIRLNGVQSERFLLDISGTSDVVADGRVRDLSVVVAGNGDLDLKSMKAVNADVRIEGVADIEVSVSQNLTVDLGGAGDVIYYGNPRSVNKHISGVGDVVPGE